MKNNHYQFSVAAYSFNRISETFIRNHAEKILPGETALITLNENGIFPHNCNLEDSFKFSSQTGCLPEKLNSLQRLLLGGSVYYRGRKNNKQLATFLKENNIRVLLAEYGPVGCAVERACDLAGVRLYVHFHGYDASTLTREWHVRYAYRRLFRSASGFIFPSNFLANKLCSEIGIERNESVHVVPCCVNTEEFDYLKSKDKKLILAVGRFVSKKAPHKTILAFSEIVKKFPNCNLEMIGDGDLMQDCVDLSKTLGLTDKIIFHGEQDHHFVKNKLQQAELFLQHSVTACNGDTEGLGVSLLEAMASGAVVIATRHNGFVETVIEGKTGFLVEENDVDGMARCCMTLLNNEPLLISMRKKARQRVEEKFTVEHQIMQLREIMGLKI